MRTINDLNELRTNLELFEHYLCQGSNSESYSAGILIARGKCFVTYNEGDKWRFVPSRFAGYYNNDLEKHANNVDKDGKETNPAIYRIANSDLEKNEFLEQKYIDYCNFKGIKPSNNVRKYWIFHFVK